MKVFPLALVSSYVFSVAIANPCNTTNEYDISTAFSSQDDVDNRLTGCTTINGWLHISHNYTGSFVLNNITNISGGISTYGGSGNSTALASIEANDLISIDELTVFNVPALNNVSFPNLESIRQMTISLTNVDAELHFTSLKNATTVLLNGPISRMVFSSLINVVDELSVSSDQTSNMPNAIDPVISSYPALEIEFPALETCNQLVLYGNITSILMPQLTSSVQGPDSSGGGITVSTNGTPLNITFPKLCYLTQMTLTGTIEDFKFPSLLAMQGFTLNSFLPQSFNVTPLEIATILTFQGNLTDVGLNTMQKLEQLSIDSVQKLDCTTAAKDWARIKNVPLITDPNEQYKSYTWKGFHCESTLAYKSSLLSTNSSKLKIGLGVGLGVPAFFALVYILYKFSTWNTSREPKPPPYDHELDDIHRHEHEEPPPTYAARPVSERPGTVRPGTVSEVSSLSDSDGRRSLDDAAISLHSASDEGVHESIGNRTEQGHI